MSYAWIYNSFSQIEERFEGKKKLLDPGIHWDSLRLYSDEGVALLMDISIPEYKAHLNTREAVRVTKGSKVYNGSLVETPSPDSVKIFVEGESPRKSGKNSVIVVRDYDTLTYIGKGSEDAILTGNGGSLVYRTSSLTWRSQGDLILNKQGVPGYLSLYALIDNKGETLEIQGGTLISNYISLLKSSPSASIPAGMALRGGAREEESSSLTYMTFPLEERLIDTGITLFPLLTYNVERGRKTYFLDLQEGESSSTLGYYFTVPGKIPNATVVIQDEDNMPLGEVNIKESQPGEEIEILLGKSSLITGKTRLTQQSIPIEGSELTQKVISFTTTVTSHSKEKSNVALRYYIGQHKVIEANCEASVKNGYLIYWIKVNPRREEVMDCQFILDA